MKIIAVGMNYVAHCHELHADEKLPEEPVIFMKPDSALLKDSKPFFIPMVYVRPSLVRIVLAGCEHATHH